MCKAPKVPKDNSAEIARQEEERRQASIRAGRASVDATLGAFDDDYFSGISDAYARHYMPQLDRQYRDAHETLVKQLASSGLSASSVAARRLSDLAEAMEAERQGIASRGVDAAHAARGDIEASRADLYEQLASGLTPADAASRAAQIAAQSRQTPTYSPLGAVFSSILTPAGNVIAAEAAGHRGTGLDLFGRGRQRGATRTVR